MTVKPKVAVFAYSEVGYVCLEELIAQKADIAIVFTHADDPQENIWFRSVAGLARSHGIPVREDRQIDDDATAFLESSGIDLLLSFYYRALIPAEVLELPPLGAYNMHGALLPRYRGRACVNWAVINGETETGATLHVMTEEADRGDIVDSQRVDIAFTDTAHDVFLKVAEAARTIVKRAYPLLESGKAPRTPQDESRATTFGRRRPQDGLIDWRKSSVEIYNLVRALAYPFPGAFAHIEGETVMIWQAEPLSGSAPPGEVVSRDPLIIGTGAGLLKIISYEKKSEADT